MKLDGEYTFDGPRDDVWSLLHDPDVLSHALPGARDFEQVDETHYRGTLQVKVGPVNGVFQNTVELTDQEPPERYTMHINARGPAGFAQGTAHVTLIEEGPATTRMTYEATLQVGGRVASAGQRLMDSVSKSLTRQGLEAMNEALRARLEDGAPEAADADAARASAEALGDAEAAAQARPPRPPEAPRAQPPPRPAYTPPSQSDVLRTVARDVLADSWQQQPALWLGAAAALGFLAGWFAGRR